LTQIRQSFQASKIFSISLHDKSATKAGAHGGRDPWGRA
jgi:hypothetical protein